MVRNLVAPSPPDATTVAVPFWSTNLVGIRVVRWINWLRAVPGAVSYMTVTYGKAAK